MRPRPTTGRSWISKFSVVKTFFSGLLSESLGPTPEDGTLNEGEVSSLQAGIGVMIKDTCLNILVQVYDVEASSLQSPFVGLDSLYFMR